MSSLVYNLQKCTIMEVSMDYKKIVFLFVFSFMFVCSFLAQTFASENQEESSQEICQGLESFLRFHWDKYHLKPNIPNITYLNLILSHCNAEKNSWDFEFKYMYSYKVDSYSCKKWHTLQGVKDPIHPERPREVCIEYEQDQIREEFTHEIKVDTKNEYRFSFGKSYYKKYHEIYDWINNLLREYIRINEKNRG